MTVKDIIKICNGKLLCGDENIVCENFSKDTRTINTSDVYVGIKVNGVEYTQCASVYDMTPGGEEYVARTGFDGKIVVDAGIQVQ